MLSACLQTDSGKNVLGLAGLGPLLPFAFFPAGQLLTSQKP